jgi:cytochrome P450
LLIRLNIWKPVPKNVATRLHAIAWVSSNCGLQQSTSDSADFSADPNQFETGRGNKILQPLLGENSLIQLDGDRHQRQRRLLTPPFHGERMRAYGRIICDVAEQVMNKWTIGSPKPIHSSMQEISMRVILRAVFWH